MPDLHKTTLWMGELEPWMDEAYLRQLWFSLNEKVIVKVIRDKLTGALAGYAFVDFGSALQAQRALNAYNGTLIPNTHKQFKLNWASGGGLIDRREDRQPEYSIFVGDLTPECTELSLLAVFQAHYRSCKSAKIMTDPRTGVTRGYGFVRFTDYADQQRALIEMQGFFIGSRPIRVSVATPKNRVHIASPPSKSPRQQPATLYDPSNTTVFVGGLSTPIREEDLRQYFSPFGEIVQVKIPPGKGCGFVQYLLRQSAELAIQQMNGYQIGNSKIRLSWGRSQADGLKQQQQQQQQQQQHQQQHQQQLLASQTLTSPPPLGAALQHRPMYPPSQPALGATTPYPTYPLDSHPPVSATVTPAGAPAPFHSNLLMSQPFRKPMLPSLDYADELDIMPNTDDIFSGTRSLLDKKTSSASSWRFNQVYAQ
ncbi:hypothetical protein BCR43DRAFT_507555 [Syncephalastrum racemosum]|uniref:RRM domain-containing protein n=1 Tax=Syncephalastrum racemosum TaxID=13706 RepID=A0A1X2H3Y5_SYNRA|nr:hypothetical protein BCR43DRAFT_507555 [Syncephalastrum racemosum]